MNFLKCGILGYGHGFLGPDGHQQKKQILMDFFSSAFTPQLCSTVHVGLNPGLFGKKEYEFYTKPMDLFQFCCC
jgi:hypothetical protein